MSEDKTQNGYEGSQELDFQDAKEMTVGEAVRKEAEINAGVTETDSILDKYIKQHREEVASQKFSKKIEADGDTSPLDAFIQKQRQEFADSGLISQSMANESINSTTATEEVTLVTFGFGATDNKVDEAQSHVDKQLPNAPVEPEVIAEPESQNLKLSLRQRMLIVSSRQKQKNLTLVMHLLIPLLQLISQPITMHWSIILMITIL